MVTSFVNNICNELVWMKTIAMHQSQTPFRIKVCVKQLKFTIFSIKPRCIYSRHLINGFVINFIWKRMVMCLGIEKWNRNKTKLSDQSPISILRVQKEFVCDLVFAYLRCRKLYFLRWFSSVAYFFLAHLFCSRACVLCFARHRPFFLLHWSKVPTTK